jgi:ATP-dependent RNA helicase DeaD
MPTPERALEMWTERHVAELKEAAAGSVYEGFLSLAGAIKTRPDADALIASMLKTFFTHRRREKLKHAEPETKKEDSKRESEGNFGRGDFKRRDGSKRGAREHSRDTATRTDAPRNSDSAESDSHSVPKNSNAKLSDRAMFEALQAGKPIPLTVVAAAEVDGEPAPSEASSESPRRQKPREKNRVREAEPGQVRLWVNLGKAAGLSPQTLVSALETEGAPAGKVQHCEILGTFSYVFVSEDCATQFEALTGRALGERTLKIERAKK